MNEGTYRDPTAGRETLGHYLPSFLASAVDLRPATIALYDAEARRYVLPRFAGVPLSSIRARDVREWLAEMQARGVGRRTIQVSHQVLSRVLRQAVADGLVPANPAQAAQPPRTDRKPPRILTPEEVEALADTIDPRYRALVLVSAYAGLRFGEAAGLRRPRVKLLERSLEIVEGLVEVRGALSLGPPKTDESQRTVAIPAFLAEELARHLGAYPDSSGTDLVFSAPHGGPLSRTAFRSRSWLPAIASAGLEPPPTFHHLRHTAAALAIAEGAHPRAIQARLGHASISTTLNLYGGLFPSLDEGLAGRLDAVREKATQNSRKTQRPTVVPLRDAKAESGP